jgi:Immunoglobulin domain
MFNDSAPTAAARFYRLGKLSRGTATPPAITAQPQSRTNVVGSTATFSVTATGSLAMSYQWIKDGTNSLADGSTVSGATTPMLTLSNVQPTDAGLYSVVVSNAAGSTNSTIASLTVMTPCISVSVEPAGYSMGTPLALHVRSFDCANSNAIAGVAAVVYINTAGTTRAVPVMTDGAGQATVFFQPLAGEAGHYAISAGLPNQPSPPAQGEFSIVGIGFGTNQVTHRFIVGVPVTNHVELRNLTDVPLSGIAVSLVNAPSDVTFQAITPATLPGNGTNTLTYVLKATAGGGDPICLLRVTSAEGATNDLPVAIEIAPPVPQLVVTPSSLHAAMLRGAQSVATFQVANVGGAASGDLEVLLPDPEPGWLGLVTSAVIPSLAPDGQAEVAVSLTPASGLTLGPYTGGVALWSTNAGQTDVPFQFDCVSALKGNLRVTVVDEFTYYAAGAPKVTNATVTLSDPYVGTNIVSAVTGTDGVALFTNLTEAYYEVSVQADQHGSFGTVVLVPGNQTFALTAFLARQMVSYRWIVTPTAIPDRYIFTLDTRFETDVPAPVMRVEPGALDLCNYLDETNVVNLTVFNSGLITAKAARLFFGSHPRFAITPLTENLGDIAGGTHVVVPVIIRRLAGTNDGPSQIEAHLD